MKIEYRKTCHNDYITIVDGDGTELLPRTCGTSKLPPVTTSFTNKAQVIFNTDGNYALKGWKLTWKEGNRSFCLGIIFLLLYIFTTETRASQGIILSPSHPVNYKNNIDQTYRIQVAQGRVIKIQFSEFKLDPDTICGDYIKIEDGDNTLLLPSFCGVELPSKIISHSHKVNVFFHLDDTSPSHRYQKIRKWKLNWEQSRHFCFMF